MTIRRLSYQPSSKTYAMYTKEVYRVYLNNHQYTVTLYDYDQCQGRHFSVFFNNRRVLWVDSLVMAAAPDEELVWKLDNMRRGGRTKKVVEAVLWEAGYLYQA